MILIDTHIWLRWIIGGEVVLPEKIQQRLDGADRLAVSAISCWEVEMLQRKGRIALPQPSSEWISNALTPLEWLCSLSVVKFHKLPHCYLSTTKIQLTE